jgi:hypothetical protein
MNKPFNKILLIVLLSFSLAACNSQADKKSYVLPEDNLKCAYYNEKDFMVSLKIAEKMKVHQGEIKGGIVPHHLLADGMIASFFKALSGQKYREIVVVAPNHKRLGKSSVNTSIKSWNTPFGTLASSKDIIQSFVSEGLAADNPGLMEEEHSISSLVPYIKYYLPDTRIIPLLIHGNYGLPNSENLAGIIKKKMGDRKFLIIASVDFSHYLTPEKADIMDEITLKAIGDRNVTAISRMTNDNLDSPPSMITLLTVMKELGANNYDVLGHDNSARITKQFSTSTTSYYTIVFYR